MTKAKSTSTKGAKAGAEVPEVKTVKKTLTAEDISLLGSNPDGYKVGDIVEVEDENANDAGVNDAADVNKVKAPTKSATEVDIIKGGSEYVRTYSKEVHGADFLDLAKEFISGHADTEIADSDSVKIVVVRYRIQDKKTGVSTNTQKSFSSADGEDFKAKAIIFRNEMNGSAFVS